MSAASDDSVPEWPDEVRSFVEYKQETAYRLLGDRSGIGGDPNDVRVKLHGSRPVAVKLSPEEFREKVGLTGKISKDDWEYTKSLIAQDEARTFKMPTPTRYEDPVTYRLMHEIRSLINEDADRLGEKLIFTPFLASLPSGDVNARISVITESSQPVFFFEQGLLQFLGDFASLACWTAPELPPNDLGDARLAAIRSGEFGIPGAAVLLFAHCLRSYVVNGNPSVGFSHVPQPPRNSFLWHLLFIHMLKFVFLHEFAHFRFGHLTQREAKRDDPWKGEYQADVAAAGFLTEVLKPQGSWALGFWACDLVLVAFDILDRALALFEFGDTPFSWISRTHPSAILRRQALHGNVPWDVPRPARRAGGNISAMNKAMFECLWQSAKPILLRARSNGARPSPIWSEKIKRSMAVTA